LTDLPIFDEVCRARATRPASARPAPKPSPQPRRTETPVPGTAPQPPGPGLATINEPALAEGSPLTRWIREYVARLVDERLRERGV